MTADQPTRAFEARHWSSRIDPHRGGEISVFVPFSPRSPGGLEESAALAEAEHALTVMNSNATVRRMGRVLSFVEAIASSEFEGVSRPTARVFDAETAGSASDAATQQVVGNVRSMLEAMVPTEPMATHDMLHEWHRQIVGPVVADRGDSGAYRRVQNWIGLWGSTPLNASFVPPPPELISDLMNDLMNFINDRTLSPIVQAAVAHAHFETIHPYGDGNGRVGRSLIYRVLSSRGVVVSAPPPISPALDHGRDAYVAGLIAYREGRPDIWVNAFANLVVGACQHSLHLASDVEGLESDWAARASDMRAGSVDHRIIRNLIDNPVLDAPRVSASFGVSTNAARDALRRLGERGIVIERELTQGRKGRPAKIFEAKEFLDLLDETPQALAARWRQRR